MNNAWKTPVAGNLSQGELVLQCPVPRYRGKVPDRSSVENIQVDSARLIVVTQSCDLANGKADHVSMCPVYTLVEFEAGNPDFKRKGAWENVR